MTDSKKPNETIGLAGQACAEACDLDQSDIEEMLSFLNPNMGYTDWMKTLVAIHDWDDGQLGIDVADRWSAKAPEKYREGDVARKWRTFVRTSDAPSVGWLVSAAKRRGYVLRRRNERGAQQRTHKAYAPIKHEETEAEHERLARWLVDVENEVCHSDKNLYSPDDRRGWLYLASRGISEDTMCQFRVGYRSDLPLPGMRRTQTTSAIVLPWTHQGEVVALRYRFLEKQNYVDLEGVPHEDDRLVSKPKAHDFHAPFAGRLFGGLGMGKERQRWLVLVEGEINCMSIWQATHNAGIDVLSYGSESSRMPRGLASFAGGYATVLVWADKRDVAERLMAEIPGAVGIQSPERDGKKVDANDMLVDGTLGLFLAVVRDVAARDDDERRWLLRALLGLSRLYGIDDAMAELCVDLGNRLDECVSLRQTEQGTWIIEEMDDER